MINIGVIGYGYWGPNLLRNFAEIAESRVVTVCDQRTERLAQAQARYPTLKTTTDYRELIHDPAVDAVVIATPVSSHFDLAMQTLRAGKHALVEKPLTVTSEQSKALIEEAERRNLVLMVDHTFVYTGAVRKIKELVSADRLGRLFYYDSVRVNLGLFQHDVNVLWDLAVHDLAIMDFVLDAQPCAIAATGVSHVNGRPEDVAYLTCFFDNALIAHFHVNWLAPVKVRRTLIGGERQMIVYDDLEPSEKIKVYDKGITLNGNGHGNGDGNGHGSENSHSEGMYQMLIGYRTGDMWAPQVPVVEALRTEALHFCDCINSGARPLTDGHVGHRVVRILEAANQSLAQRGQPVELY